MSITAECFGVTVQRISLYFRPASPHVLVNGSRRGEPHHSEPALDHTSKWDATREAINTLMESSQRRVLTGELPHERPLLARAKPRSVAMNRSSIGTLSFTGSAAV